MAEAEVVFLETSALLRVIFREDDADVVQQRLMKAERVLASRLLRVETERVLLRVLADRAAEGVVVAGAQRELAGLWPVIDFFEMTREICDLAGRLAPAARLRSLDAIHLATFHRARR